MLSIAWLVGTTAVLTQQRNIEVSRQTRQCHQIQDDARSRPFCAKAKLLSDEQLCRFKEIDCDRWPLEEERYVKRIALLAVGPIALAWVVLYGSARMFRWSDEQ